MTPVDELELAIIMFRGWPTDENYERMLDAQRDVAVSLRKSREIAKGSRPTGR